MKTPLQEAVENTGLTDKQIASEIRVSVPTVNRWRTGANSPYKLVIPNLLKRLKKLGEIK